MLATFFGHALDFLLPSVFYSSDIVASGIKFQNIMPNIIPDDQDTWQSKLDAVLRLPPDDYHIMYVIGIHEEAFDAYMHGYASKHKDTVIYKGDVPIFKTRAQREALATCRVLFVKPLKKIPYAKLTQLKDGFIGGTPAPLTTCRRQHIVVMTDSFPDLAALTMARNVLFPIDYVPDLVMCRNGVPYLYKTYLENSKALYPEVTTNLDV